ncbi:MAG: chemotaxis protein CheA, partial [Pseudomonadota bacterium]
DARDHMLNLLESNEDSAKLEQLEAGATAQDLVGRIAAFTGSSPVDATDAAHQAPTTAPAQDTRYVIRYAPEINSLKNGHRSDLLLAELAELGEMTYRIDASVVPALDEMDPQASYLIWHIELFARASLADVQAIFVFLEEAEYEITQTEAPSGAGAPEKNAGTGQATPEPMAKPAGETAKKSGNVRVPAARLNDLMDQLGELVIAQTRLDQLAHESEDSSLLAVAEEIDRLINGLRDSTLAMRMLPIEIVFGKFRRVVRSLADDLGKEVSLVTMGGDTELDKTVIDSLTEPLVHMIRNSMDHGIESREERIASGKPATATVGLAARQAGGEVLISVTDDGRGLDDEKIIAKARERGLIGRRAEDVPPPHELHQLIFEPAFSTAQEVSDVSGRGVGMDAVRQVVNDLRGSIDIRTQIGVGSTITLRLPVTLAIIDGLLVRVGKGVFVLPLSSVNECVELAVTEYQRDSGRTMLRIRDELVPFMKLDETFGMPPSEEAHPRVVIVSTEGRRIGLVVDDVLGQHQTVIKTFSCYHRDIQGFAGSTILGDGRVALIIDVMALIRSAQTQHAAKPPFAA